MSLSLLERMRRLLGNVSTLAGTRLGLFSLELQEELERQIQRLALLLGAFLFFAMGLLFAAVLVLVLAWQSGYLLEASGALALLFIAASIGCALYLRQHMRVSPTPFAATLDEFRRDGEALRQHTEAASEATSAAPADFDEETRQ